MAKRKGTGVPPKEYRFNTIAIGTKTAGYGGATVSFIDVDGTNAPLVPYLRVIDQTLGTIIKIGVDNGTLKIIT